MKSILSTKLLSARQQDMVLNAGIRLVQYDAIKTVPLPFDIKDQNSDALIITSQNGAKAFLEYQEKKSLKLSLVFCVGEKTKALIEGVGMQVVLAENAERLAKIIVDEYQDRSFLFLSGKQRLDVLPKQLKKNNVRCKEIHAYNTLLTPKQFDRTFDGILFFSPSGVESHFKKNTSESGIAFCIGPTTEKAAKNYAQKTVLANRPSIENVLIQAIKELRPND